MFASQTFLADKVATATNVTFGAFAGKRLTITEGKVALGLGEGNASLAGVRAAFVALGVAGLGTATDAVKAFDRTTIQIDFAVSILLALQTFLALSAALFAVTTTLVQHTSLVGQTAFLRDHRTTRNTQGDTVGKSRTTALFQTTVFVLFATRQASSGPKQVLTQETRLTLLWPTTTIVLATCVALSFNAVTIGAVGIGCTLLTGVYVPAISNLTQALSTGLARRTIAAGLAGTSSTVRRQASVPLTTKPCGAICVGVALKDPFVEIDREGTGPDCRNREQKKQSNYPYGYTLHRHRFLLILSNWHR